MNVLFAIDDNFAPQLSTTIISLCENNRDAEDIHLYVLGMGLAEQTIANLAGLVQRYGRELDVIDAGNFMESFDGFDTGGWNQVVLARLLMGSYLPESVHRVIYLDADMIVVDTLRPLWETELAPGKVLGAVIEATIDDGRLQMLNLTDSWYFNAGMLLVDLDRWRAEDCERRLVEYCRLNRDHLTANDQDAISGELKGQIQPVPVSYNWGNTYEFYPYRFLKKLMDPVPYYPKDEYEYAVAHPAVVHFWGEDKPWREGSTHTFAPDYDRYLSMGPYAGTPKVQGWTGYFKAWKAFNVLTHPFPGLRYRIITALVPKMLARRAKNK